MPIAKVFNMAGEKIGEIELSEAIFGVEPNKSVLHDSVKNHLANCRQGTQSALTKGEVSYTTRKPWRQKGTGRARAGYAGSPVWTHGGVAFAPKPRDYSYTLNKKVKRIALKSALSAKAAEDEIIVIDGLKMDEIKTKTFDAFLKKVGAEAMPNIFSAYADTAYAILDDIKRSLPEEFQKARRILRERDEIIEEANTQANHTIDDANAQASIMVSEQEVVRLANNMAADIKRHAEEDARDTRYWAEGVADKTLEQLQNQLHIVIDMASHLLDQTQECRNLLTGVAQADEPAEYQDDRDVQ